MRPSAHGDVIHSRPVAINYGTDAPAGRGVLRRQRRRAACDQRQPRAILEADRDSAINGVAAGQEIWSFVAPEFFPTSSACEPMIQRDRYLPTVPCHARRRCRSRTASTVTTAYKGDEHSGSLDGASGRPGRLRVRRRGHRIRDPSPPSLKWKIGCPNADQTTPVALPDSTASGRPGPRRRCLSPPATPRTRRRPPAPGDLGRRLRHLRGQDDGTVITPACSATRAAACTCWTRTPAWHKTFTRSAASSPTYSWCRTVARTPTHRRRPG